MISYRHPDRRVNNPEVGLVNTESDPEQPKTVWSYDPHLDPALQFDSARAQAEADARRYLAQGITFVGVGSDLGVLRMQTQALADKFRNPAAGAIAAQFPDMFGSS